METIDIFDHFEDVLIVKEYDGYYCSVLETLKILLLGLFADAKTFVKYTNDNEV